MLQAAPDHIAQQAADALISADRVLGPICVLLLLAICFLAWAYYKARNKIDDLNEKRIVEAQASTKALADTSHVLELLTETIRGQQRPSV